MLPDRFYTAALIERFLKIGKGMLLEFEFLIGLEMSSRCCGATDGLSFGFSNCAPLRRGGDAFLAYSGLLLIVSRSEHAASACLGSKDR